MSIEESKLKSDTATEEKMVQKTMEEFGDLPKQNMLLNLNPIMMNVPDKKINEEKLYKLRNYMEDPAN